MSEAPALTREEILYQITRHWDELQSYLATLTEDQLTRPTDAAGWTIKDHVVHLAMWEKAALALLNRQSRRETLDIPAEIWDLHEDDTNNAYMQARTHDLPLDQAMALLRDTHASIVQKLDSMTEADLMLPYAHYNPTSTDEHTLMEWMPWETYYHYRDHIPWMQAIAATP